MTLVVVQAFGSYGVGSKISDPAAVIAILAGPNARCVVVQGQELPQPVIASGSTSAVAVIPSKLIVVAPLGSISVGTTITDLGQIASILTGPYRSAVVAPSDAVLIAAPSGIVALGTLGLANLAATIGVAFASAIYAQTPGSTITASASDGTILTIAGGVVSGVFSAAGSPIITLTETLAAAVNSPQVTSIGLTVSTAAPAAGAADFTKAINSGLVAALAA